MYTVTHSSCVCVHCGCNAVQTCVISGIKVVFKKNKTNEENVLIRLLGVCVNPCSELSLCFHCV